MQSLPKLDFPPCRLRISRRDGDDLVWDDLRRRWLVLTPEEWVRRHLLAWLVGRCGVPAQSIGQEYPVDVNGQRQRADVVVVDDRARPLLIAECKAPAVRIDAKTLAQAVRYNSVVGARYVVLTNGLCHYCCEYRDGAYRRLPGFPDLKDCGNSF